MIVLRSALFAIVMWASVVVFALLGLFTLPFPFSVRYGFISQWARFNLWWLRLSCGLGYEVEGREHIPESSAIVLCKHQSAWETLALQEVFPPQVWVMKRELLRVPFFGWGLAMLEPIAIDRSAGKKAMRQLVEQGRAALDRGRWVVIFPEGTRVPPGRRGRYALGGATLAVETGRPVVPVAHNAGEYWPRRGFLKRPGTIRMVVGPPIETAGRRPAEVNREVEDWIEATMERITTLPADRRSGNGHD